MELPPSDQILKYIFDSALCPWTFLVLGALLCTCSLSVPIGLISPSVSSDSDVDVLFPTAAEFPLWLGIEISVNSMQSLSHLLLNDSLGSISEEQIDHRG